MADARHPKSNDKCPWYSNTAILAAAGLTRSGGPNLNAGQMPYSRCEISQTPWPSTNRSIILKPVLILIPAALLGGSTAAYISILYIFRAYYRSKERRPPAGSDFSRAPGPSSGSKIDTLNGKIGRQAALLITLDRKSVV